MTIYHKFVFFDEKNDVLIKEINLEDILLDYIDEKIECDNDSFLFNLVPTINPDYIEGPHRNIIPKDKGLAYTGISIINHYGFDCLKKMFLEWINVLEKLDVEYYYPDLIDLTEDELAEMSVDEIEELKEFSFVKSEVMKKLKLCIKYLNSPNSPDFVVYSNGI